MNTYFHRRPVKTDEEKGIKWEKIIKDKVKKSFVKDKEKEIQNQNKKIKSRLGKQKLHSSRGKIKVSSKTMRRKKFIQDEDKKVL